MLLLTRKIGEQINIGDDIIIRVVEISRGKVRLGIEAPKKMPIHRHEVYERIQSENVKASMVFSVSDIAEAARILREKKNQGAGC